MLYSDFLLKIKEFKKNGARIVHVCAKNDINGNPQRLYFDVEKIKPYDEGYLGYHAVPEHLRKEAYEAEYNYKLNVSADFYNELLFLDDICVALFN